MGALQYIRQKWFPGYDTPAIEHRAAVSDLERALINGSSLEGCDGIFSTSVNESNTVGISAVFQAISVISQSIASLPCEVFRQRGDSLTVDKRHPAHRLVNVQADDDTTSFDFMRTLIARALLGDGYARIYRDELMRPVRIQIVIGDVHPGYSKDGKLYYIIRDQRTGWNNDEEVVPAYDIIHLRNQTFNALSGSPVVKYFKHLLSAELSATMTEAQFFKNGASVDKYVHAPVPLSKEQRNGLESRLKGYAGAGNAGRMPVLDGGIEIKTIGLNLEQAALIPARRFHITEVARIFNVTPHLLHDLERATFNNAEQLGMAFVTYTLQPWIKQIEQQFALRLLTEVQKRDGTHYVRINMNALLRSDVKTRGEYYKNMITHGVMSPNEVRALENMNRRDGGDIYLTPLNHTTNPDGDLSASETQDNNDEQPQAAN